MSTLAPKLPPKPTPDVKPMMPDGNWNPDWWRWIDALEKTVKQLQKEA